MQDITRHNVPSYIKYKAQNVAGRGNPLGIWKQFPKAPNVGTVEPRYNEDLS